MKNKEFITFRKKLEKTQSQMAELLGISLKAVHSYEQGWRSIPAHIERQMLFLLCSFQSNGQHLQICWDIKNCPEEMRERCPAWEFNTGNLCWFINGTICLGIAHKAWKDKIKICRKCEVLGLALKDIVY